MPKHITKLVLAVAIGGISAASAQPLRSIAPVPGYVCMLAKSDAIGRDAPMPPIKAEPSTSAATLVLSDGLLFVKTPIHRSNDFLEVLTPDRRPGWFPANDLKPFRSVADPKARCEPTLMSNGRVGQGP